MNTRHITLWLGSSIIAMAALFFGACSLNPQPIPPGADDPDRAATVPSMPGPTARVDAGGSTLPPLNGADAGVTPPPNDAGTDGIAQAVDDAGGDAAPDAAVDGAADGSPDVTEG